MDLETARILVIDDNADLDVEQDLLEWAGSDVVVVRSAKEAREALAGGGAPFAAIVADLVVPDRGGRALIEELRAAGDRTPAVAISGYPEACESELLAAGFDRFLPKPVDTELLMSVMRALVEPAPAAASAAAGAQAHPAI